MNPDEMYLNVRSENSTLVEQSVKQIGPLLITLQIVGGQVALPLFVGTMLVLSNKMQVVAHPALINFCITWIVYSIIYCLTVYDRQEDILGWGRNVCTMQGILVHGVVPMTATSYAVLIFQVWSGLRRSGNVWAARNHNATVIIMIAAPYVAFIAFSIFSAVVVVQRPDLLVRSHAYYCTISYQPLFYIVPIFAGACILITLILEALVFTKALRLMRIWRENSQENRPALSMIIRIGVFSGLAIVVLVACIAFTLMKLNVFPYFIQAALPLVTFLVFGTRRDVFWTWCFWRKPQKDANELENRTATPNSDVVQELQSLPQNSYVPWSV
ncbi:hypothetical protein BD410DRAFT_541632 [Rickenella mellea]|uniref:G-protein coupled receptors family 1 profile domain-containing protein n=1 Tax=Rickenella mellea TaxID=50990 RepID=A0A4Y7PST9_9AGAM|nr:hypothetical protein BD410DRAFT_541632 [Rickenella mellea]